MTFRLAVRVLDQEMRRDLRFVNKRLQPRAHTRAMNTANTRVRTRIVRGAQNALGLPNQKSLRRQIRVPKTFRARRGKDNAGGVFGAFVPKSFMASGEDYIFLNSKPTRNAVISRPFVATMRSGHSGIFVRVLNSPKRRHEKRPVEVNVSRRTELPIAEVFSNALNRIVPVAQEATRWGYGIYAKEFDRQISLLLRSVKSV